MRPLEASDFDGVAELWERSLGATWPVDAGRLRKLVDAGVVADGDEGFDGVALLNGTALVALVVDPPLQRTGIGRRLLETASPTSCGSGGSAYLWPGVPDDLGAARAFFAAAGWEDDYRAWDHVVNLAAYEPPLAPVAGITFAAATPADHGEVVAFNHEHFPQWARYFEDLPIECAYVARQRDIVGTLLLEWPGAGDPGPWTALLGRNYATLGAVGVDAALQNNGIGTGLVMAALTHLRDMDVRTCHIGWLVRTSFYERCGSTPWRSYTVVRPPTTVWSSGR